MVHPVVIHTHRHHLLKPLQADLFAVVNLWKSTSFSGLNGQPESELTRRGTERWRVQQALTLLGARVILFEEDDRRSYLRNSGCEGARGAKEQFWTIQLCGEAVRKEEVARGNAYAWLVRTRPDTFFRAPVRAPPALLSEHHGGFFCHANDAFFVASASAAPALFALHSLANDCHWTGNSSLSRSLPREVQCGLGMLQHRKNFIWPDCIMRLAAWRYRLVHLQGCLNFGGDLGGRDFFRAYYCRSSTPCFTQGWESRLPGVYYPMPATEGPREHGNLTLDADIHKWGVATGAILTE